MESCDSDISFISKEARDGKINKVKVKNTLENLRSVLDYLIIDILHKIKSDHPEYEKLSERIYFPFGEGENLFKKSVAKNLPPLKECEPKIYSLIEGIQPFKINNNWIIDLCSLTNEVKHNRLTKTRKQSQNIIQQNGLIRLEGCIGVSLYGNYLNGVRQDDVFTDYNNQVRIIRHSNTTDIFTDHNIKFEGKEIEIAPFLSLCHKEIKSLVAGTYPLL